MIQSQKKTRIEWLDAMRGFTMILVVIIFWCITVLLYFMLFMPSKFNFNTPFWAYSSLTQTIKYLQFFIVGILARHYWGQIENIFDSKNFSLFCYYICCMLIGMFEIS